MNLKFTAQSLKDLYRLRIFIAKKNPIAAAKYIENLVRVTQQLRSQPKLGKEIEDEPLARQLVAGNYIVRYSIRGKAIYILKIWHGKEER